MSASVGDAMVWFLIFLLIVLFIGEPDLHDALIKRLMECR